MFIKVVNGIVEASLVADIDFINSLPVEVGVEYIESSKPIAEGIAYSNGIFLVPENIQKTQEERIELMQIGIQSILDNKAKEFGYDNILSACSYAGYPNQFQTEGQNFLIWRSDVWTFCYSYMNDVIAGIKPEPTMEELSAQLPVFQV